MVNGKDVKCFQREQAFDQTCRFYIV